MANRRSDDQAVDTAVVFNITSGQYAPPEGKKVKVTVAISPSAGPAGGLTYTCADDSDPLEYAEIASVGQRDRATELARAELLPIGARGSGTIELRSRTCAVRENLDRRAHRIVVTRAPVERRF
jgi:hypothetical protein